MHAYKYALALTAAGALGLGGFLSTPALSGTAESKNEAEHLAKLSAADFEIFMHRDWKRFKESHSEDVLVHWPDGHTTRGLASHTDDIKRLVEYAPDIRVLKHDVEFAKAEWTAVVGVLQGTFTAPMQLPGGGQIAPTGRQFTITMCTLGRWKGGVMVEEYVFWDNATLLKQMGIS